MYISPKKIRFFAVVWKIIRTFADANTKYVISIINKQR